MPVNKLYLAADQIHSPNHHKSSHNVRSLGELTPKRFASTIQTVRLRAFRYRTHYVVYEAKMIRGRLVPISRLYAVTFEKGPPTVVGARTYYRDSRVFALFYKPDGYRWAKLAGINPRDFERNKKKDYPSRPPLGKDRYR